VFVHARSDPTELANRDRITCHSLHRDFYPLGEIEPSIIRFLGQFNMSWHYKAEVTKVRLVSRFGVPVWAVATSSGPPECGGFVSFQRLMLADKSEAVRPHS